MQINRIILWFLIVLSVLNSLVVAMALLFGGFSIVRFNHYLARDIVIFLLIPMMIYILRFEFKQKLVVFVIFMIELFLFWPTISLIIWPPPITQFPS